MKTSIQAPYPHATPFRARNGSGLSVEGIVVTYAILSICLQLVVPAFKVFSYGIPILCLIALLASGRISMPPNAPPYLILMVAGLASAPIGTLKGLQDLWLMLIGLAPFFFGYRYRITWWQVFAAAATIAVTSIALTYSGSRFGSVEFDPSNSVSTFESSTSFIFAILAAWAALERRWGRFVFALLLAVLTLKRIAVLAAVVVLLVELMPRRLMNLLLRPLPMLALNAVCIGVSFAYAQGGLDVWIQREFHQSPDQFGLGRQGLYYGPVKLLLAKPVQFLFYGTGPGTIYEVMRTYGNFTTGHKNLHNDSLKILVEYGGIAWTLVICALYWSKSFAVRAMMMFTNILWLTDNTLIYQFVILPTAIATGALLSAEAASAKVAEPRRLRPRVASASGTVTPAASSEAA